MFAEKQMSLGNFFIICRRRMVYLHFKLEYIIIKIITENEDYSTKCKMTRKITRRRPEYAGRTAAK
jgi:hypothetical protein